MAKQPLLNFLKTGSQLICIEEYTTSSQTYVIVDIDGTQYRIIYEESSKYLLFEDIHRQFEIGVPSAVVLKTNSGDRFYCFIIIHDIPQSLSQEIHFSVCVFEKGDFMYVRFAQKNNKKSPNFALGCFDVNSFIREFRRESSQEYRIPVLWKMLINALRKIGYFDIYAYNDFQTSVLLCFQRMFFFPQHISNLRKLFYSFVQRILANNAWFLIVEQSIQPIRRPSHELIELFSEDENPPIVNFIHDSNIVGLTKHGVGMGYLQCCYALVSVSTTKVRIVHDDENAPESLFDCDQESNNILSKIFPSYDGPPLTSKCDVDKSAISQGISNIGPVKLVLFNTENSIDGFIQRDGNGTFEQFPIQLLILSKIFEVGDEFCELTKYFTHFSFRTVKDFINEMVKIGFFSIFDGTATIEEISNFLILSNLGYVLQKLRCEIDGFPKRLGEQCLLQYQEEVRKREVETPTPVKDLFEARLYSIQKNRFIVDFKRIFVFLLEKLENRDDLTPEIQEILCFLEQLVEFLKPV